MMKKIMVLGLLCLCCAGCKVTSVVTGKQIMGFKAETNLFWVVEAVNGPASSTQELTIAKQILDSVFETNDGPTQPRT